MGKKIVEPAKPTIVIVISGGTFQGAFGSKRALDEDVRVVLVDWDNENESPGDGHGELLPQPMKDLAKDALDLITPVLEDIY